MMWLACEQPERPPDEDMHWHVGQCQACIVKARAEAAMYPDDQNVRFNLDLMLAFAEGRARVGGVS